MHHATPRWERQIAVFLFWFVRKGQALSVWMKGWDQAEYRPGNHTSKGLRLLNASNGGSVWGNGDDCGKLTGARLPHDLVLSGGKIWGTLTHSHMRVHA